MYDHINNYFTGDTALIKAAWYGQTESVRALLSAPNIDPDIVNIQNNRGKYLFFT